MSSIRYRLVLAIVPATLVLSFVAAAWKWGG